MKWGIDKDFNTWVPTYNQRMVHVQVFLRLADLLQQSEAHTIPSLLNPFRSEKFSVNTAVE